jgi:putative PEP-CTERM system TPR-repeat lipoprotein
MNALRRPSHKAIVVALALTLTACGKSPEQHFQQAQELAQKADFRAAVIELKTVLQKQPDNREARLLLGEIFIRNEAYPQAEKELSKARNLGVPDDRVLPALANIYVRMGESQKALDLGIPETGLSPRSLANLHTARAEALLSQGKKAEAEQSIRAGIQSDPNQPALMLTQAKLALIDRKKDEAVQFVDHAIEKDPTFAEALYLKAALLESENKPDDAARLYRQILANDPSQFRAHLAIAGLHLKKGEVGAADKAIQAAEKVAAKAPLVMYARGTLELQRGKPALAASALQEVLRVAPNHLPAMLAYAMASYGQGNYEQSIKSAGKVLGAAPNSLAAAKILAGSKLKAGDIPGAVKALDSALPRHPGDPGLMALAGDAHLRAGNYVRAMAYLDRAAELAPENPSIRSRQAAGHLATGNTSEALADLEAAVNMSDQPGQADLELVVLNLRLKKYDNALKAIAKLEQKLPNNPVTHNMRATAMLGKQDRTGARQALEKGLAIDPGFEPAIFNLARLDIADQKPAAARKRFESMLAQDKTNVRAMMALAGLAAAERNEKGYVAWLEKGVKADPSAMEPRAKLVQYYLDRKENEKALAVARQASGANPNNPVADNLLGIAQFATGDHAAAIATFSRLTEKAPRSPDAHLHLAQAHLAAKQTASARDALKKAIQLKPDFVKAHDALIRLELAEKRPDAALRVAREIQVQQPRSPLGFDREGNIQLGQKRFPQAIKAYEQALAKGASTPGFIKLHRTLLVAGETKVADQRLADWIKQNPKDLMARAYAADVYMQTNRSREAITQYQELLRANPKHVSALNNLANLYQREKDSRALSVAEQAYKLAPNHPGVQDTLGWILIEQGQLARGLDLLGKAATQLPKVGLVRYHYGSALARAGKKAEARKELEAAIASGQKFTALEDAKSLLKNL